MKKQLTSLLVPILFVVGYYFFVAHCIDARFCFSHSLPANEPTAQAEPVKTAATTTGGVYAAPKRTKTTGCAQRNALPDPECTPGAVFASATREIICVAGYTKSVRNVSVDTKTYLYQTYGVAHHYTGEYEVDHLIPLELGGSNELANLWPEPANPTPGFHQKDEWENELHDRVCNGTMALEEAQRIMATDWLTSWQKK